MMMMLYPTVRVRPSLIFRRFVSSYVNIVEVGPRDGLQNEKSIISTSEKVHLVHTLQDAGLKSIEVGAFVSPNWVPQMANSLQVLEAIQRKPLVEYHCLVPNLTGMQLATSLRKDQWPTHVAIFASASESFSQKNINCSINESFERFKPIMSNAQEHNIPVRGYISCVAGCPYEGDVPLSQVVNVTEKLVSLGCYQVSLGDTIGVGTPGRVGDLLNAMESMIPRLAVHFHDTYGQALANILRALEKDVTTIDSSIAGLGGCPYAKGASGNVATEDVVYMLHGMGVQTGLDLGRLVDAGEFICKVLKKDNNSKVAKALTAKR